MDWVLLSSLVTAATAGFIVISYESFAHQAGYAVGRLFMNNIFRLIFGGFSIIGSVGYAMFTISMLSGLSILAAGFIAAFALVFLLKSFAQWVALMLLLCSWILQFFVEH